MKILFIGGSIFSEEFNAKLQKMGVAYGSASETFVNALIYGLNNFSKVKVLTEFFVPTYPRFKKLYIKGEKFCHKNGSSISSISYINIPIFQRISKTISFFIKTRQLASDNDVILLYEVTSRTLLSTALGNSSKKIIIVVPDLPEFMSDNSSLMYKIAKKIDAFIIKILLKRIAGYVLLSPYMKEKINIENKPYMVLEGIFNPSDVVVRQNKESDKKIILYTGKIEKWFGLEDLFRAFMQVKYKDCELWLCGSGDLNLINNYCEQDSRIKYLGSKTHEEVLLLQKKAYLLINPRHSFDEFTKYSFPSKTMEYMASGTPTLMCKLGSLPLEYHPHLYFFEDESISGMTSKIEEILSLNKDELNIKGKNAAEFIINNKNSVVQADRLIKFIKEEIL